MIAGILAAALAVVAIASQPTPPPPSFARGMERRGAPVVSPYFIGMEWPCQRIRPWSGETCYAGLELGFDDATGQLVTGP
jgi:hypothetical protein